MCRECAQVLSLSLNTNGMCWNGHSVVNGLRMEFVELSLLTAGISFLISAQFAVASDN
jgi:hypothetical protein